MKVLNDHFLPIENSFHFNFRNRVIYRRIDEFLIWNGWTCKWHNAANNNIKSLNISFTFFSKLILHIPYWIFFNSTSTSVTFFFFKNLLWFFGACEALPQYGKIQLLINPSKVYKETGREVNREKININISSIRSNQSKCLKIQISVLAINDNGRTTIYCFNYFWNEPEFYLPWVHSMLHA